MGKTKQAEVETKKNKKVAKVVESSSDDSSDSDTPVIVNKK